MTPSILYAGDTSLGGAAGYLAGLMSLWKWDYDYVSSDAPLTEPLASSARKLFIFSDYSAKNIASPLQHAIVEQVAAGAGLLMIGGWESFHGYGGDWEGTAIGDALPVVISTQDDRINCDQPCLLLRTSQHPAAGDLPWEARPPTVGGFNRIEPRPSATVVLEAQRFAVRHEASQFDFERTHRHPMLVVGAHGSGRTAALATDLAPHWVGGLVDWGPARVIAKAKDSWQIEVGSDYAGFIKSLLIWAGKIV